MADIGVEGHGPTLPSAFEQAALAVTAIVTDPEGVRGIDSVDVHCKAPDIEILLADWLNAMVFEMATRRMVFGSCRVTITDLALHGRITGEPIDMARHQPVAEVKGATLTELSVVREPDGTWRARCVVDV